MIECQPHSAETFEPQLPVNDHELVGQSYSQTSRLSILRSQLCDFGVRMLYGFVIRVDPFSAKQGSKSPIVVETNHRKTEEYETGFRKEVREEIVVSGGGVVKETTTTRNPPKETGNGKVREKKKRKRYFGVRP